MFKYIKKVIMVLLFFLFSLLNGCVSSKTAIPVIKTKEIAVDRYVYRDKYIYLPDELLLPCKYPTPVKKEKYLKSNFTEREGILVRLYLDSIHYLKVCNMRLEQARLFQMKMKTLYEQGEKNVGKSSVKGDTR